MKFFIVFVLCLIVGISASSLSREFESYKTKYGKVYSSHSQNLMRMRLFAESKRRVEKHNAETKMGFHTHFKGINQFSDMTMDEKRALFRSIKPIRKPTTSNNLIRNFTDPTVPDTLDYRTKGYVTPVQNQGKCGADWAFAVAGAVEAAHFKATGQLINLSEQQIIDCDSNSQGCAGGTHCNGFNHIVAQGGLETDASYPYEEKQGPCRFDPTRIGAKITDHNHDDLENEERLKETVALVGPVTTSIDGIGLMEYQSGVLTDDSDCSTDESQRVGILVIGYGSDNGNDYWLIKNSWGEGWGESGYARIGRNMNFLCGIGHYACYPTI